MIKFETEISFVFENKIFKSQKAIVGYTENNWYIEVENQDKFNEFIQNKIFITAKKLIDYCKKHKIVLSKETIRQLSTFKTNKLIQIKFTPSLFIEGNDDSGLYNTSIIELIFNNKKAYFYIAEHDCRYDWGLGSDWKEQSKNNSDSSKIWKHIYSLDRANYICLNDIYDKVLSDYYYYTETNYEDEDEAEEARNETFNSFARKKSEEQYVATWFLEEIGNNISDLTDIYYNRASDREIILQSIFHVYINDKDFFNNYIDIDQESFEKIVQTLNKSIAISSYQKDKLENTLTTKKEDKVQINKI